MFDMNPTMENLKAFENQINEYEACYQKALEKCDDVSMDDREYYYGLVRAHRDAFRLLTSERYELMYDDDDRRFHIVKRLFDD